MKLSALLPIAFLLAATLVPAFAQAQGSPTTAPVPSCSQECKPKDVNPNAPNTGSAATRTILYAHFKDALNQAPLNTQLPDPDCTPEINQGFLMPVVDTKAGVDGEPHFSNNDFTMFSSAGLVEYNRADCSRRQHEEPGTAEDLTILSENIVLYFYLSAHAVPGASSTGGTPGSGTPLGVMPQVAIKARMETGRHYNNGEVIAEGDTGAADQQGVIGGDGRVNVISTTQGDVYEFVVPMKVQSKTIKSIHSIKDLPLKWGFIVTVIPYQIMVKDGTGKGSQVAQGDWRFRASADFPPRIVFDVDKAMQTKVDAKTPPLSTFRNKMFIRWSFVSPFGSSDIDDSSLMIHIQGPPGSQAIDPKLIRLVILKRSINHDGHFLPVNATWEFDYPKAGLGDGKYDVHMSVNNLQGTYRLENLLSFEVKGGQLQNVPAAGGGSAQAQAGGAVGGGGKAGGDAPSVGVALVALTLLGAMLLRRRYA